MSNTKQCSRCTFRVIGTVRYDEMMWLETDPSSDSHWVPVIGQKEQTRCSVCGYMPITETTLPDAKTAEEWAKEGTLTHIRYAQNKRKR